MRNPYLTGSNVYRGGSSAATMGTVDPMGYIDRELKNKVSKNLILGPQSISQTRSGLAAAALRRQQGMGSLLPPTPMTFDQTAAPYVPDQFAIQNTARNMLGQHERAPSQQLQAPPTLPGMPTATATPIVAPGSQGNLQPTPTGHIPVIQNGPVNYDRLNSYQNQQIPHMDTARLAAIRQAFPWFGSDLSSAGGRDNVGQQISAFKQNVASNPDAAISGLFKNAGAQNILNDINIARQSGTPGPALKELRAQENPQDLQNFQNVNHFLHQAFPGIANIAMYQLFRKGFTNA